MSTKKHTESALIKKRRFAAVGTGGRSTGFLNAIAGKYHDSCELAGLCDTSRTRRLFHQERLTRDYGIAPVPDYGDFDQMLRETSPDAVIVCTPDHSHHEFIVKSLEFGAEVISEKPLTTDAEKCGRIFDAVQRTGRRVRTLFNMRWMPGVSKVRELIGQGAIGRVRHIDFEYLLNTVHGADYFRRWHAQKACSGGLLIHKSTHHFDMINWWMDAIPATVYAIGDLVFYGKKNAIARGDEALTKYDRYTGVPEAAEDPFRFTLDTDPTLRSLYYEAEAESGYVRDRNVFRDNIDIEDSMSLAIKYRTGEMVAYSLNAFTPEEGFRAHITGDRGRIEYVERHATHLITESGENILDESGHSARLQVQKLFSKPFMVEIPTLEGDHGGADLLLHEQMFSQNPSPDALHRSAGHEQGAASLLVGAAANQSMASGKAVSINSLIPLRSSATRLSELT